MNPTQSKPVLQQAQATKAHDPVPFKTFLKEFSPDERKQFLNNMTRHFTHMITRHMRKMKEASQRMRDSFQKK